MAAVLQGKSAPGAHLASARSYQKQRVDAAIGVKNRRAQAHEAKAAAALPVHGLADAALLAIQHLLQARQAVRGGVFAHFDADPAPSHLVGDGGRGAGAEEAVEDEVVGVGGDLEDALQETFGFGRAEASAFK